MLFALSSHLGPRLALCLLGWISIASLDVSHPQRALVKPLVKPHIFNRYLQALKMELFRPEVKKSFSLGLFLLFTVLLFFQFYNVFRKL